MTPNSLYPMGTDCLIPAASSGADVVQVVIGYNYSPSLLVRTKEYQVRACVPASDGGLARRTN